MGKKRRILRSPKFAHLRRMRKWRTLIESNTEVQPSLIKQEAVEEVPALKKVEQQTVTKVDPYEMPVVEENKTPVAKKVAPKKKATTKKTRVAAKKKPATKVKATKTRARKTTSKK